MNPTLGLGLLLAGLLTGQGLQKPSPAPDSRGAPSRAPELEGGEAARELARRNTDFGFKLYRKLASSGRSRNVFFSPISISMAFSMLCLGAQDATLDEIRHGLNLRNMPEKALHEGFHYLLNGLNQDQQNLELSLSNTLFVDQRLRPEKRFLAEAQSLYHADAVPTDYQNLERTKRQINDYISRKTQGRIGGLVQHVDPGTVMLLTNCIFFRATWQHQFDPKATKEEDFFLDGNKPVKVPMMFRGGMYKVGHDDQLPCTVLQVPYQDNVTATFVLPDVGRMKQVEEALRMDTFHRWKKIILRRVVDISLPRFSITGTYDLKKTLSHLGVTRLFEDNHDLTKIVPNRSLKVGEAVHKAKLKLDERGAEGAAGSGVQTLPMETPVTFKLNRPFLLLITEDTMTTTLFMGKIANPTGT